MQSARLTERPIRTAGMNPVRRRTTGRIVEVAGARLYTEERGARGRAELLFLHGGLGTLDDWGTIIDAFADCRCVLLDARGHGASTPGDGALDFPRLAMDAEAIIKAFELNAPIIIGHSDGGITGVHVAGRGRVPVRGLVTIGAQGDAPPAASIKFLRESLTADRWRQRFPDTVARYEALNPTADFDRLFGRVLDMWCNTATGNYPGAMASAVQCPALVMAGDDDPLVQRDETLALARAIKGAQLGIIPFGSHAPHWERPERMIPFLREFVFDDSGGTRTGQPA